MPTVPTVSVLLDDGTGTFPTDITSKVLAVDGYRITRGRDDWQGAVTAGQLTLTLNNSDGRFTPGSTILGSPSPIKVDQQIRVVESPGGVGGGFGLGPFGLGAFGGSAINRFTGYVKSWPVSWPETVTTFSTVDVTATDAQARAERRTLRSMLEEEILSGNPTSYYPLTEDAGSTSAGDISGNAQAPLTTVGVVGIGLGTGPVNDLLAAAFTGAGYLVGDSSLLNASGGVSGVAFVMTTTSVSVDITGWLLTDPSTGALNSYLLRVNSTGHIEFLVAGSVAGTTSVVVDDGLPHFIEWNRSNIGLTDPKRGVWVDGSQQITANPSLFDSFSNFQIGAAPGPSAGAQFVGTLSNLIVGHESTLTQISNRAAALDGFAGETADARIARLAGYAAIPTGTLDVSSTIVGAQDTAGGSAQDAIQAVVDAEMGLAYIDGSGSLTFHNRSRQAVKTAPDLILDSQYVTPDVQPVTDDQQIINYFETTTQGTGATQVARNAASETTHGRYPVSQTYLVQTDAEALDRGSWIVAKQAEPTTRYGTLTINLYKMSADMAADVVAALDLDCWLRVTSLASQNPGGTVADVVVQGWDTQVTAEGWAIACNVVSRSLYTAFILDSSLLDGVALLAV